ncbi:MAG: AMP-binding protein, partial [Cycloclasticus sp.]|nr:AMP-binding protein [Cycloclasticus sp.]MBQ0789506.1 AMP-binding protein [Cycloclasticus sp.]
MPISPFLSQKRIDEMIDLGHWENMTLLDHFDQRVSEMPDQLAVVDYCNDTGNRRVLTYQQLAQQVNRIAFGLVKLGVEPGDAISCQLPNRWEFLALYLASIKIGAALNPLMPIFRHREVSYMMGFAEAKVVVVAATFRNFNYLQMMQDVQTELPYLKHVLAIGEQASPGSFEEKLLSPKFDGEFAEDTAMSARRLTANSVTQLLYTSGTTGDPKAVMHTSNSLLSGTKNFVERYGLKRTDNILMSSPLGHQTGFLVGVLIPMYLGTKVVYQDVWDADKAIQFIQDEQVHFTMASTPFLADMTASAALDNIDTRHFKTFVTGGAPIPRIVAEKARKTLHCEVYGVYGMTENLAVTACGPGDSDDKIYNTDGVTQKGNQVRIVDAENKELPRGEEGQVQTRGAYNCCGYLKRADLTDQAIDSDGWLSTGDLARMDDDGFIRITGRLKDILIRGGENIPVVEV